MWGRAKSDTAGCSYVKYGLHDIEQNFLKTVWSNPDTFEFLLT